MGYRGFDNKSYDNLIINNDFANTKTILRISESLMTLILFNNKSGENIVAFEFREPEILSSTLAK